LSVPLVFYLEFSRWFTTYGNTRNYFWIRKKRKLPFRICDILNRFVGIKFERFGLCVPVYYKRQNNVFSRLKKRYGTYMLVKAKVSWKKSVYSAFCISKLTDYRYQIWFSNMF
jgi:hypothetical protein